MKNYSTSYFRRKFGNCRGGLRFAFKCKTARECCAALPAGAAGGAARDAGRESGPATSAESAGREMSGKEPIYLESSRYDIYYKCGHEGTIFLAGDMDACRERLANFQKMNCPVCSRAEAKKPKRSILKPVLRETWIISSFLIRLLFKIAENLILLLLLFLVGGTYYCAGKKYSNLK